MAMGAASIGLLTMTMMVSLQVLLVAAAAAGNSAAAVSGGTTIRLPSDARGVAADLVSRAMARAKHQGDEDRPWECCDLAICTLSIPPICRCFDKVDRCSDACKECKETEDSRHVCVDTYYGDPGPRCHEHGNKRGGHADAGEAAASAAAVMASDRKNAGGGDEEEKRPWKCCDVPVCTRSWPPVCRCADTVERCASTCEHCELVEEVSGSGSGGGGGPRYRCLDRHHGDPGPSCGEERGGDHDWAAARRLAGGQRI